jgi:hypothetical protein
MSTRNPVRINRNDFTNSGKFVTLIETAGTVFNDGYSIELIKDASGSLRFLDSKCAESQPWIMYAGQIFVPPGPSLLVLTALTFASGRADYGETANLFAQIFRLFIDCGLSEHYAQACAYFAFASWFPEFLPVAPCLIFTGSEAQARTILRLLAALTRLALPLAEINIDTFDCVTKNLQPTLLISYVDPKMSRVLLASNHPHAYLSKKRRLIDLFCVKAVYWGPTLVGVGGDAILNVHCVPSSKSLPVLNSAILEQIAAKFHSMFLDYRFKNIAKVQNADFDAPTLPSPFRTMAQSLGSCIVDDPELQTGIIPVLETQRAALGQSRLLDLNYIVIEALLARCHSEIGPIRVGVSELATTATTFLTDHGETAALESKRMGGYLRQLGFRPERDSKGFSIDLTADVRRLTHRLARERQVLDSEHLSSGCSDCSGEQSAGVCT